MSRDSYLVACLVLLITVWILPPIASANSPSEPMYIFPVAASANGAGGTVWKTELCMFNPWAEDFEIIIGTIASNQQPVTFSSTLDGDEIECFSDIVQALGLPVGHANFLMVFSVDGREFFANSRIYNTSLNGEYGQTVEPGGENNPYGFMESGDLAAFTGVKNYGTPGGAGYRTNIGIFNLTDDEIDIQILECTNPTVCLNYKIIVPATSTVQKPMRSTNITEGVILVGATDTISTYISTVNNKSGDAVFQGHRIFDALTLKSAAQLSSQAAPVLEWIEANTKSTGHQKDLRWYFDHLRNRLSSDELFDQTE